MFRACIEPSPGPSSKKAIKAKLEEDPVGCSLHVCICCRCRRRRFGHQICTVPVPRRSKSENPQDLLEELAKQTIVLELIIEEQVENLHASLRGIECGGHSRQTYCFKTH